MQKLHMVIVGDSGTGKTSLLKRFCNDEFSYATGTTAVETERKDILISGMYYQLVIWDLPGQHRFREITPNYFRRICAVVLVYDVTDRRSFEGLNTWFKFANDYSPEKTPVMLVGNKTYLSASRKVTKMEGMKKAKDLGVYFVETSAKDGQNVEDAFRLLAGDVLERSDSSTFIDRGIQLQKRPAPKKSCKC